MIQNGINSLKPFKRMKMKKKMFILCLTVMFGQVFVQTGYCGGEDPPSVAVYWLNGVQTVLPKTGHNASANAIAVSGSDVHIAGSNDGNAVYWLNGVRTVLPKTVWAYATAIAVSGSDVYITGSDGGDAVYWLNGVRTVLPKTGNRAEANAITVSGSDVYIAGEDGDWFEGEADAVYWLNGTRTVLDRKSVV